MGVKYRPNVAAILRDRKGKILVGERLKHAGAWQFPQGGVDEGESLSDALFRELEEKIGLPRDSYEIVSERGGYRYEFVDGRLKFGGYGGQEQTYFLCDFVGKKTQINIETAHPEFRAVRWIHPSEFDLKWVPKFKRSVYHAVFNDFFQSPSD